MSGGRFMKLSYCSYSLQAHMKLVLANFPAKFTEPSRQCRENIPFVGGMLAFWEGREMSFRAVAYIPIFSTCNSGQGYWVWFKNFSQHALFNKSLWFGMRQQLWQTIPTCCGGCVGFPQLYLTLLRSPERFGGLRGLGINILIFLTDTTWYTSLRYSSLMINLHKTKNQEGHFCHFQLLM